MLALYIFSFSRAGDRVEEPVVNLLTQKINKCIHSPVPGRIHDAKGKCD